MLMPRSEVKKQTGADLSSLSRAYRLFRRGSDRERSKLIGRSLSRVWNARIRTGPPDILFPHPAGLFVAGRLLIGPET